MYHRILLLCLLMIPTCGTGCLILPLPYLHPSYIPAKELPDFENVIVTRITQREKHSMTGWPDYPYQCRDISVELVATDAGWLPTQFGVKPECFCLLVAPSMLMMLPLPGYIWYQDSISLRIYRRGYLTNTIKNWDRSQLRWKRASNWEERERAIDQLLYVTEDSYKMGAFFHECKILESIPFSSWFDSDGKLLDSTNSVATKKRIQQALKRVAQEYQALEEEMVQGSHTKNQLYRITVKRREAQLLANGNLEMPPDSLKEVALGSPIDIHLAHEILQNAAIPSAVYVSENVTLYVSPAVFTNASALLLKNQAEFGERMYIREK